MKHLILAITCAIIFIIASAIVFAKDTDLQRLEIKAISFTLAIVSAIACYIFMKIDMTEKETKQIEQKTELGLTSKFPTQSDFFCPYCYSDRIIVDDKHIACLECGSLTSKKDFFKKIKVLKHVIKES